MIIHIKPNWRCVLETLLPQKMPQAVILLAAFFPSTAFSNTFYHILAGIGKSRRLLLFISRLKR